MGRLASSVALIFRDEWRSVFQRRRGNQRIRNQQALAQAVLPQ